MMRGMRDGGAQGMFRLNPGALYKEIFTSGRRAQVVKIEVSVSTSAAGFRRGVQPKETPIAYILMKPMDVNLVWVWACKPLPEVGLNSTTFERAGG